MLRLLPEFGPGATVLCIGAHCDDIEIGCGGALLELQSRHPQLRFHWQIFSGRGAREDESRAAARSLLGPESRCSVDVDGFEASFLPFRAEQIKQRFEALRAEISPDLVFTHFLDDRHQDHRLLGELTWNTFRSHAIFEYEIAKYEGDLARPNVYFPLSAESVSRKVDTLLSCFPSQRHRQWFDAELFRGLMRLRGVECNSPSKYAEAFHARKLIL